MNGLQATNTKELSPYDPSYPITLLSSGLKASIDEADRAAKEIYNAVVKEASIGTQLATLKEETKWVVEMTEEIEAGLADGSLKLLETDGKICAKLMEAGRFGDYIPIKKETLVTGLNPTTLAMAMQMKAMQKQIEGMSVQLDQIDRNVKGVLRGQQNDRIAQYYTGVALYVESQGLQNEELRKSLISQAVKALSDASFKLRLNMQGDVQYLQDGEYKNEKKKRTKLIDERMNRIHEEFAYIHQASLLKAAIYCQEKEYGAMATVLDEYSYFIDKNIAENANFLAQCDASDNGTNRGLWESRANLKLDASEIKKQLTAKEKTLLLSVEGE